MSNVIAVIGSGYGDEGKGLMTDYYSSKIDDSIVVRSNGGAQAGHTVTTPNGERHVFSHFGSGTFNGRTTYLSDFFVANPMLLAKEIKVFKEISKVDIEIIAHPNMLITTPYDMLLNQRFETSRGDEVHGSVGVGFGETLERAKQHSELTYRDVIMRASFGEEAFEAAIYIFLDSIRTEYVPTRVNMNKVHPKFIEILNNDDLIYDYVKQLRSMLDVFKMAEYDMLMQRDLIFEGAQGLLLDMDYGYFPHVTRSNCGMRNIKKILRVIPGPHDVTVNYVTRAYSTRHGAGPLENEDNDLPSRHKIVDETNLTNEWQGSLRFAPLNYGLFESVTNKDFANYAPKGSKRVNTITCMDQLDGDVSMFGTKGMGVTSAEVFKEQVAPQKFDFQSYGPTRDTVQNP